MNLQPQQMLEQAIRAFQIGDLDGANLMLKRVLQIDSKNLFALNALGLINASQANYKEAADYLGRAVRVQPNDASMRYNLAKALSDLGNDNDAIVHHKKAVSLAPNYPEAWLNYGKSASKLGLYNDALIYFERAITLKPNYADALINKGAVFKELKKYKEALICAEKALLINPNLAQAWSNKGATLYELKQFDEALIHFDKALALKLDNSEAWSNKGATLYELKQFDEALIHFDKALALKPDNAEAWSNKGLTLHQLKRIDEALIHFDKALALKPNYSDAWTNKGLALHHLKRFDEALIHFDKALALKPDDAQARFNKAQTHLFLKKYEAGWKNYDWRLRTKDFQSKMPIENLILWNGSSCKNLLIYSEQGIGDIIFYASILKIAQKKVDAITVSLEEKLMPILSRSFPEIIFIDNRVIPDVNLYDAQLPIGSLPVLMNIRPDMEDRKIPYLKINEQLTEILKINLPSKKRLRCGVAWKSNNQKLGKNKNVSLSELKEIFYIEGYEFINLQYGNVEDEIKNLVNHDTAKLINATGIDLFNDIDGLLAIINTCDFIVTTSNVTAHLAGAIGKPTFLLVPYSVGRIWYWHDETISSWYPSISLHSQDSNFRWNGAINDIALRLKNEIFKLN